MCGSSATSFDLNSTPWHFGTMLRHYLACRWLWQGPRWLLGRARVDEGGCESIGQGVAIDGALGMRAWWTWLGQMVVADGAT
jgi:hypothetical protein